MMRRFLACALVWTLALPTNLFADSESRFTVVLLSVATKNARVTFRLGDGNPDSSLSVPSSATLGKLLIFRPGKKIVLICQRDGEGKLVVQDVRKYRNKGYWLEALLGLGLFGWFLASFRCGDNCTL